MTLLKVLIPLGASLLVAACSGGSDTAPASDKAKAEPVVQVADVTVEAGVNRVGPSLHGVVGRPVGHEPDYRYSTAMAEAGGVWDEQHLYDFLMKPRDVVPGTKMTFVGIKDGQRRADIIAYLKTQAN